MSSISSTSSSSDSDQYAQFDELVDELFTNHLPTMLLSQQQAQPVNENECDSELPRGDTNRRDREQGHERLFNDYFANNSVYNNIQCRRKFRMQRPLFCRIMNKVVDGDQFFQRRRNAAGRLGLSPLQKCTAAIRMLAYGLASDAVDEYYLRSPTDDDLRRILHQNEMRGFPSMIGSIDCMHWEWKNCPTAWKAQYAGRSKNATLILEALADQDLWIWHAFFGILGSCNDLNVLYRSSVFDDFLHGRAPPIHFSVNGHEYAMRYYLANDIYPKWATFIQGITHPQIQKDKLFAEKQAAARKDVERAFGVLLQYYDNPHLRLTKTFCVT
ncbi:uncharacterized protein LOC110711007 [Chenopodium quinoa]|uniref:uncharacterized protein LOC110711007 n=1 Tax=Chenopodium quinoa TaxID=63459 RepID=UPI000B776ECC|nr:uncharacterized protein LOC110711007 [Chenopodium quinoa]